MDVNNIAIGEVNVLYNGKNARIEVLAYREQGIWKKEDIVKKFPDEGKTFARGYTQDNGKIVLFTYEENNGEEKDKTKLNELRVLPQVHTNITDEELCTRQGFQTSTPDRFYFLRESNDRKYICGPLNATKQLAPLDNKKEISAWECKPEDIIKINDIIYLLTPAEDIEKRESCFMLDCMSIEQFQKWAKDVLKTDLGENFTIAKLLKTIKDIAARNTEELHRSRLKRLMENINILIDTVENVKALQQIPAFSPKINEIIAAHREKFFADAQKEVDKQLEETKAELRLLEDKVAQKKSELQKITEEYDLTIWAMEEEQEKIIKNKKNELDEITKNKKNELDEIIKNKKNELDEIDNKYSRTEKRLKELQKKRETLIEDIQLQAEIFGGSLKQGNVWHYPLEQVTPGVNALQSVELENIKSRISDKCEYEVNMSFFPSQCKGWQVEDIRLGIALAHITGNAAYQLCQPSPQWISFKEFWDESLQVIWESAHGNPEKWHFLLIENYNIALPECWGMPLWNILMGKATLLPCAQTPHYPNNLRIIVSSAAITSEDNTHLGLPTKINDCFKSYSWPGDIEWNKRKLQNFKEDIKELNNEFFITVY